MEKSVQTAQCHPLRETVISESPLPVTVKPAAKPSMDPMAKLRADVQKILDERKAPRSAPKTVPKSRILSMSNAAPEAEPVKDYHDILSMLLAKK